MKLVGQQLGRAGMNDERHPFADFDEREPALTAITDHSVP